MNKELVTKFDLDAAFKALDDIETPKAEGGIRPNVDDMQEAFKSDKLKTDELVEDYYNVGDQKDLEKAKDDRQEEVAKAKLARIEKIVDLDAETPEDLQPSYVGKVIIQCPQCMTLFYKKPEDIEPSEDDDTVVNVNEVCQHCGNASGYTVVGKVDSVSEEEKDKYVAAEESGDKDDNELDLSFDEPKDEGAEKPADEEKPADDAAATEPETKEEKPADDGKAADELDLTPAADAEGEDKEKKESLNASAAKSENDSKNGSENKSLNESEEMLESKGDKYVIYGTDATGAEVTKRTYDDKTGKVGDLKAVENDLLDKNEKVIIVYVSKLDSKGKETPIDHFTMVRKGHEYDGIDDSELDNYANESLNKTENKAKADSANASNNKSLNEGKQVTVQIDMKDGKAPVVSVETTTPKDGEQPAESASATPAADPLPAATADIAPVEVPAAAVAPAETPAEPAAAPIEQTAEDTAAAAPIATEGDAAQADGAPKCDSCEADCANGECEHEHDEEDHDSDKHEHDDDEHDEDEHDDEHGESHHNSDKDDEHEDGGDNDDISKIDPFDSFNQPIESDKAEDDEADAKSDEADDDDDEDKKLNEEKLNEFDIKHPFQGIKNAMTDKDADAEFDGGFDVVEFDKPASDLDPKRLHQADSAHFSKISDARNAAVTWSKNPGKGLADIYGIKGGKKILYTSYEKGQISEDPSLIYNKAVDVKRPQGETISVDAMLASGKWDGKWCVVTPSERKVYDHDKLLDAIKAAKAITSGPVAVATYISGEGKDMVAGFRLIELANGKIVHDNSVDYVSKSKEELSTPTVQPATKPTEPTADAEPTKPAEEPAELKPEQVTALEAKAEAWIIKVSDKTALWRKVKKLQTAIDYAKEVSALGKATIHADKKDSAPVLTYESGKLTARDTKALIGEALEAPKADGVKEELAKVEDIDEALLQKSITESLTNVYDNVESFTLKDCDLLDEQLTINGEIKFKSGQIKGTKYVFTEAKKADDGILLLGTNDGLGENGKFALSCKTDAAGTKLLTNGLSYDYCIEGVAVKGDTGKQR